MMWVIGHRGAPARAVENTLESLRIAVDEGADGVECDVQATADGELVLLHDDTLERLGGDVRRVDALNWRSLRAIALRAGPLTAARATHLDEVLAWWAAAPAGRRPWLNIEVKIPTGASAASAARLGGRLGARLAQVQEERIVASAFDPAALAALARWAPGVRRAALFADRRGAWQEAAGGRPCAEIAQVHPCWPLCDREALERWCARGWPVWAWTIAGDRATDAVIERAAEGLVAAAICDDPRAVVGRRDRARLPSPSAQGPQ